MKKILFPTDFSETANNAFIYALNIAKATDASILTLHAYALPDIGTAVGFTLPNHLQQYYESIDINELENFRAALPALKKIAADNGFDQVEMTHSLVSSLDTRQTILDVAAEENVDLIVMGTTGAGGFREVFFGSNTAEVMENANCPVLAIPKKGSFDGKINKIAITTEYTKDEEKALDKTIAFAKALGASVECINVDIYHTHRYYNRMALLKIRYEDEENVSFKVLEGNNVENTITRYLEENETDILVMLTHKRSFIEELFHYSVTKKMAYHSTTPIMSIQAHALTPA